MGDLNTTLSSLDTTQQQKTTGRTQLQKWIQELNLCDPWRIQHDTRREYTSPKQIARIDYILLSTEIFQKFFSTSQHIRWNTKLKGNHPLAPTITLQQCPHKKQKDYWRARPWLLQRNDVQEYIKKEINLLSSNFHIGNQKTRKWNTWKLKIAKHLKTYQYTLTTEHQTQINDLNDIEKRINKTDYTPQEYENITNLIDTTRNEIYQESVKKTFQNKFEETLKIEERSSKYLFRPLTTHRQIPIDRVSLPNGQTTSNPKTVETQFIKYWGSIFGDTRYCDKNEIMTNPIARKQLTNTLPKLTDPEKNNADREITLSEIIQSIKTAPKNSAPGLDGLPYEFYQIDPVHFAIVLRAVYQERFNKKTLATFQNKTVIRLFFKGGDIANPACYRPISLMQTEVKIITRILTFRIAQCLPKIIDWTQTGFMKGRLITDNIMRFLDIQDYMKHSKQPGYAYLLDFEKAYDRVSWLYLQECLQAANFGPNIITWFQILYKKPQVQLILSAGLTLPIYPERGVKQGDPLSCLLYNLSIEPHLRLQKAADNGIQTPTYKATADAFADDNTLYARNTKQLIRQRQITSIYEQGSGARLNPKKSIIIPLNKHSPRSAHPQLKYISENESTKILGFPIGQNIIDEDRITTLETNLIHRLYAWRRRAKTISGRRLLVNSKILSTIWYTGIFIDIPTPTLQKWQNLVNNFIIYGQVSTKAIVYSKLPNYWKYTPNLEGGLQIPLIQDCLYSRRIKWLHRKYNQNQQQKQHTFQPYLAARMARDPTAQKNIDDILWTILDNTSKDLIPYAWQGFITAFKHYKLLPAESIPLSYRTIKNRHFLQLNIQFPKQSRHKLQPIFEVIQKPTEIEQYTSDKALIKAMIPNIGKSKYYIILKHALQQIYSYCKEARTQEKQQMLNEIPWSDPKQIIEWHTISPKTRKIYIQESTPIKPHPITKHQLGIDIQDYKKSQKIMKNYLGVHGINMMNRIHLRLLPLGFLFQNQSCIMCNQQCPETYQHLFWECIGFQNLIGPYLAIFTNISNISRLTSMCISKFETITQLQGIQVFLRGIWLAIYSATCQTIWYTRCQIKYAEHPESHFRLQRNRFLTILQFHLLRFSTRYRHLASNSPTKVANFLNIISLVDPKFRRFRRYLIKNNA